jgi:hypothetical protein
MQSDYSINEKFQLMQNQMEPPSTLQQDGTGGNGTRFKNSDRSGMDFITFQFTVVKKSIGFF